MIAFDAGGGAGGTVNPGTSISWNHTCSGTDRLLLVTIEVNNTDDLTAVTYNSVAMTRILTVLGTAERLFYYYLKNPASGTNTVSVTKTASEQMAGNSASYTGVLQTGGTDATSSGSGTSTTFTGTLTTVADNCWTTMGHRWQAGSETAGAGTTIRTSGSVQVDDANSVKTPAGSSSLIINGANSNYIYIIASFAPAPAIGNGFLAFM